MELKANDIKLQHKAAHCNSGNFTSRSCTAISIQGCFFFSFLFFSFMKLSRVVTYDKSRVSHSFRCPCEPQGTEAGQVSNPPQGDQRVNQSQYQGSLLCLQPSAQSIRSPNTASGLLSK